MNSSSKGWKKAWNAALSVLAAASGLLAGAILLYGPEDVKGACLAAVSTVLAVATLGVTQRSKVGTVCCFAACLLLLAAITWCAFHSLGNEVEPDIPGPETKISDETEEPEKSEETTETEKTVPAGANEASQEPDLQDSIIPEEVTLASDGIDLLTVGIVEEDLTAGGRSYFPELEMWDYRHLFLSLTEECPDGDTAGYQTYILDSCGEWDIEKLKQFIQRQFQESYQTVEDYPAGTANESGEIAKGILRLEELEGEIHQARAANEPMLPLYDEVAAIYLEIIDIAPRGEYYIQLARPYEEGILRMTRAVPEEKNAVLQRAANAVACFRTALTYQDPVGDSVQGVFYRIAKIYHYIGDTPGLHPDIRAYFYRVAAAYLTLASELETESDTYYGYYTYYCAMVYHKLAIITTSPKAKLEYLDHAEALYQWVDEAYQLDDTAKNEVKHALSDVDVRRQQLG